MRSPAEIRYHSKLFVRWLTVWAIPRGLSYRHPRCIRLAARNAGTLTPAQDAELCSRAWEHN